ncbi:MFS transporter [Acidisoma cellulosilytica]|uniref:MFS transporter n=1 Tax=Acidisoma cellulosilyticum TaxID=2802395 RepID=A0A963Z6P7_9PROT|nr:MFS transporter [Acidisoma cellulosilyticum]MCB8883633.1 MFS transporter [Acidisoma cellulosilyticum]
MAKSVTLPGVRPGTIPVMAVACGVMVATIYLCQPLLGQIAHQLGVPEHASALVAVAAQIGYTIGILFVVPLSDAAAPKKLVQVLLVLTILGLLGAALAPGLGILLAASLMIATTSVVAQILIPLATTLASPENRGRIVGSLTTGLIMGILLSRTVSGIVAQFSHSWRAPYLLEAVLLVVMFFVVPQFMPERPAGQAKTGYFALLKSLPPLLRHRPLLLSMGMNFCVFGGFSALWATLAFHLETPAFGLGPAAAGLFGLWGAPGALLAPIAGRLSDRWGSAPVNCLGLLSAGLAFVFAGTTGATSIVGLVIAVNLLDFGLQSGQVANQTRIFGIAPEIRGRLNTIYMVATFGGGALGALAGGYAWSFARWTGVCTLGLGLVLVAAAILTLTTIFSRKSVALQSP